MSDRWRGLESVEALLAPEQLLPTQYGHAGRDSVARGERALMLAVLQDAIHCLEAPRREARAARETEAWIRSDDQEWPFSFLNLCASLEIDAAQLRRELLARAARRRAPGREFADGDGRRRVHPRPGGPGARMADLPRRAAQG